MTTQGTHSRKHSFLPHQKRSIIKVLIAGFIVAGIAATLLVWSIYAVTKTVMSTATSVSQTYEVISAVERLQRYLMDAETGERGYVITGEPGNISAYLEALQKIQWESDFLTALTADNPVQKTQLSELRRLIAYRLKTIQIIVDTRKAGSIDAAHELVSIKEDKLEMDGIKAVLARMENEENAQLNKRLDARNIAYRHFWWTFFALIAALFVGAVTQFKQVRRIIHLEMQAEQQIRHLAEHDPLTDLPNRRLLQTNLDLALAFARRSGKMLAVMFVDLDDFKAVNDKFGHQAGDDALIAIAQRLREGTRSNDLVARLGGDEFVVVLADLDQPESATRIAHTLTDMISKPIEVAGTSVCISASIGISLYPDNGQSSEQLLGKADDAAYLAKSAGKNQYRWAMQS